MRGKAEIESSCSKFAGRRILAGQCRVTRAGETLGPLSERVETCGRRGLADPEAESCEWRSAQKLGGDGRLSGDDTTLPYGGQCKNMHERLEVHSQERSQ
ncbi:hypothetical protein BDP67DRAFT_525808 [Colletotrichum lupini]|nr:hypothetical protein BDP67DRAFT_525808 [Colletotrichum lupini]